MRWKKFKNFKCFCCVIFCIVLLSLWTFTALFSNSSTIFDNNNDPTKNFLNDKVVGVGDESASFTLKRNPNKVADGQQLLYGDLPCIINGEQILTCLRDNNEEIYIPFKSFLSKYYSVRFWTVKIFCSFLDVKNEFWHVLHWRQMRKTLNVFTL